MLVPIFQPAEFLVAGVVVVLGPAVVVVMVLADLVVLVVVGLAVVVVGPEPYAAEVVVSALAELVKVDGQEVGAGGGGSGRVIGQFDG